MQRRMGGYIFHRMIETVVLLNLVLIFVFLLLHLTGDPVAVMMPQDATQEDIERLRRQMGFDKPFPAQFVEFYGRALKGDFGPSWEHGEPALKVVLERFPASLELAAAAFLISIFLGIPLGALAAYRENTLYDRSCMIGTVMGQSVPDFWLGLMLIMLLSVWAGFLPSFGRGGWTHLIMPAFVASTYHTARLARLMRSQMLEVLRQDYIQTARSKGLAERIILFRHALKNSAIPIVTVLGIDLGVMLGGTVIIETVFAWPGVGRLAIESIHKRDFPVVQVTVFLLAAIFVLINLAVDILYAYLDPRIEHA